MKVYAVQDGNIYEGGGDEIVCICANIERAIRQVIKRINERFELEWSTEEEIIIKLKELQENPMAQINFSDGDWIEIVDYDLMK